jgi:hypothetical protein
MSRSLSAVPVLFMLATCALSDADLNEGSGSTADEREMLQLGFDASPAEQVSLRNALREIRERLKVGHLVGSASRFGEGPDRYFLFLIPPPELSGGHVMFGVVVMAETPEVGPIFDTGIPFGPESVSVEGIRDMDGDGLPDVLWCQWVEEDREPGRARATGFRDGEWYSKEISDDTLCQRGTGG